MGRMSGINQDHPYRLALQSRLSTDAEESRYALGCGLRPALNSEEFLKALQGKISPATLFTVV